MFLIEIFQRGFAKRWEGMLELVFLLVTLCLLASSHHTYVQLLPTVRTHCNRNYKSIERERDEKKKTRLKCDCVCQFCWRNHPLLVVHSGQKRWLWPPGQMFSSRNGSPAQNGTCKSSVQSRKSFSKKLTLRESVASDMILSQPLKVATWKRDK